MENVINLGVIHVSENKYFIPFAGEVMLHEPINIFDVYEEIYEAGVQDGIKRGKELKSIEIKKSLNIQ